MSNMSYCRFRNTLSDLRDCYDDNIEDLPTDVEEARARRRLVRLCITIAAEAEDYEGIEEDKKDE